MIDIHSHILPGIDDGSESLFDSLKILRIAEKNEITDIIATPHSYCFERLSDEPGKIISEAAESLTRAAEDESIRIRIHTGEEILFDEDTLPGLKSGKLLTLCNSRYVLTEFQPDEDVRYILFALGQLSENGYIPVIAHPERYICIQHDITRAYKMKDAGALLQVNSQSIFGLFGRSTAETARRLIFGFDADFIASDSHNPYFRSPELAEIHEIVSEETDFRYANTLLLDNPSKVLSNEDIFPIGSKIK